MGRGRKFIGSPREMRLRGPTARAALFAAVCWMLTASGALRPAAAADLPDPEALERDLRAPPEIVDVVEPHMSTPERRTIVAYRGWPAIAVLDYLFGKEWNRPGREVVFRALDGYVARIPAPRFDAYPAYLVFASPDRPGFTIDNPMQNEVNVPLGPYYLVWDNIRHPGLLAGGASYWPYQVSQVLLSDSGRTSLLPGDLAKGHAEDAALAQEHCLPCHTINGYGGDKWPLDLARRAKELTAPEFERWVLAPTAVKPGTAMPPLAHQLPEYERVAMARRLFAYLRAVPAMAPPDADASGH